MPVGQVAAFATREQYDEAVTAATEAAKAYYNTEVLLMDDAQYDLLVRSIAATEEQNPQWAASAVTTQVAGGVGAGDVGHTSAMLSLDNVFSPQELQAWCGKLEKHLGQKVTSWTVEPKLDGLALSAIYQDGNLVRLVTRGDGESGEDVSHAIDNIVGLPAKLTKPASVEIRGEVMLTDAQFHLANETRVAKGHNAFANPRNGASGALRAKDRDYVIEMTFFAYTLLGQTQWATHSEAMAYVLELGVQTTSHTKAAMGVFDTPEQVADRVEKLGELRDSLGFDIDGAVVKANVIAEQQVAGSSSRAPRWAIAYKYPSASAISVLEEVFWQVGRTGVITPRARITPTEINGTVVTYATLHNPGDMERKGFMLGDRVSVYKAGEVIPRVEAPMVAMRTGEETPIAVPESCPNCGADLDKSQARWRCSTGRLCKVGESIEYAVGRDCLDIEGLGEKLVTQLVQAGLVASVADLFSLTKEQLLTLDRTGEASVTKVLDQIQAAKNNKLSRVFCSLGVLGTGRSMSRRLARHFNTMDAILAASVEELQQVDGIGKEKAPVIITELQELKPVIDQMKAAGVNMVENPNQEATQATLPFVGKKVCVSGSVPGMSRTQAAEAVELLGGTSVGSVSKNTNVLVAGEGAGSKLAKAEQLGVEVMDAETFAALVAATA